MEHDVLDGTETADRAGARVVNLTVNGERRGGLAPVRMTLADFLRHELGLTGTHLGCEHGVCGACTVIMDGAAVRSCLLLAVQADGATIETIEGLAPGREGGTGSEDGQDDELGPLQQAFHRNHALQCGFCTGGFLMSVTAALRDAPVETDDEAREVLSGNICRCTGYAGMIRAVRETSDEIYGPGLDGTARNGANS
ncbi:MAG TPA: (2Fe-2S)-binding protein [Trebonia sp.]|jgi:aerobic-type carbon monoxide dehydrogenase small subunit (CoxS/CutS family)|nr:(2Fe-2S)-binding protein [Trebonia sp.]